MNPAQLPPEILLLIAAHIHCPCSWFAFSLCCKKIRTTLGSCCYYRRGTICNPNSLEWITEKDALPPIFVDYGLCTFENIHSGTHLFNFFNGPDSKQVVNFCHDNYYNLEFIPLEFGLYWIFFCVSEKKTVDDVLVMLRKYSIPQTENGAIKRKHALAIAILYTLGRIDDSGIEKYPYLEDFVKVTKLAMDHAYSLFTGTPVTDEFMTNLPISNSLDGPKEYLYILNEVYSSAIQKSRLFETHLKNVQDRLFGYHFFPFGIGFVPGCIPYTDYEIFPDRRFYLKDYKPGGDSVENLLKFYLHVLDTPTFSQKKNNGKWTLSLHEPRHGRFGGFRAISHKKRADAVVQERKIPRWIFLFCCICMLSGIICICMPHEIYGPIILIGSVSIPVMALMDKWQVPGLYQNFICMTIHACLAHVFLLHF